MKFALISHILPPAESAHAAVIHRLLNDLDPDCYCLISSRNYDAAGQPNYSGRLRGNYYHLRPWFQLPLGSDYRLRALVEGATFVLGVALRARAIAQILKSEECSAVVICTGGNEVQDFPAAYLASRLVGARFYPYLLDQYIHMVSYGLRKTFLRRLELPLMKAVSAVIETPILRRAAAVITHNEFQRDEVFRRYRVEAEIIHNPCDLMQYEQTNPRESGRGTTARGTDELKIVYTGGVGDLHYQPFRNLIAAIELLDRENVRLHMYTYVQSADCEREGIHGPVVFHGHEVVSAMPGVQQEADVLFLPLGFEMRSPEVARTAAPGKMGEYLAASRPILVHAPSDSFIAWYFRRHECGLVVDQNDPRQLADGLESLLTDSKLRERLCQRAGERARADFSLEQARAKFAATIGLDK
jgi:glycosyltransferase involved in cell wall biosynthesis